MTREGRATGQDVFRDAAPAIKAADRVDPDHFSAVRHAETGAELPDWLSHRFRRADRRECSDRRPPPRRPWFGSSSWSPASRPRSACGRGLWAADDCTWLSDNDSG
jgi:hypothetical protein